AWQSIKAKLLSGVSIGFRAIEEAWMNDVGAYRFLKTEVLELSLVTIPANASASIATVKSLALAGPDSPGDSGTSRERDRARRVPPTMRKAIAEQIRDFENTRAAKAARQNEIMSGSADSGATLDEPQAEEYDGLAADVRQIDAHLVRLRDLEKANVAAATRITTTSAAPGDTTTTSERAALERGGARVITVKANLPPGMALVRYAKALVACQGNKLAAVEFAKQWNDSTPEVVLALKAAVAPGTTTDATWAGPLVQPNPLAAEFLEYPRPATPLGRIPNLRLVPFNISVQGQTGGGTYGWVGQGAPKPIGKLAFNLTTLGFCKVAGIIVISEELARFSSPSAEDLIRRDMR